MAKVNTRKAPQRAAATAVRPLTFNNLLEQRQDMPAWIMDMHRYFAEHGRYRGVDLNRVLGQPGGYTEGHAVADYVGNGFTKKTA